MTGILLLAIGHKNYYEMACNLAISIGKGVNITLAWHGFNPIGDKKAHLFDNFIKIPTEYITKNGEIKPFRAKTQLHKITPYQNTLYFDVDLLFFAANNPNLGIKPLLEELKNAPFTIGNWGEEVLVKDKKPMHNNAWAKTTEVADAYDLWGKAYNPTHSEVIWFKKTQENLQLFELATEIFDSPKVKTWNFAGDVPDEFAFNVALSVLGIKPHKDKWRPFWWVNSDRKMPWADVVNQKLGVSMAGNKHNPETINKYNIILKYAAQKAGIDNFYKFRSKKEWLKERATI